MLPLFPTDPADSEQMVAPFRSAMVMMVLLNVALMWATALVTFLRIFLFGSAMISRLFPYRRDFTDRFTATVRFGPFRVRAFVRVLCPRTGSPRR